MKHRAVVILPAVCILAIGAFAQQPKSTTQSAQPAPSQAQGQGSAQAQAAPQRPTINAVLDRQLGNIERQFVSAAEAMPADKFNFAPSPTMGEFKDVRTFAEQIKHVATVNMLTASALAGEKSQYTLDDAGKGPASIQTREQAIQFLKDSFAAAHRSIATITDANATEMKPGPFGGNMSRLAMGNIMTWHGFDHYGQMVVYLRMNGIVPPASRPQN